MFLHGCHSFYDQKLIRSLQQQVDIALPLFDLAGSRADSEPDKLDTARFVVHN